MTDRGNGRSGWAARFQWGIGVIFAAALLAGCGATTQSTASTSSATSLPVPPSKVKVAVLSPTLAVPIHVAIAYGAYEEAKKLGITRIQFNAATYSNVSGQMTQFQDAMADGVQAIILLPAADSGYGPYIAEAKAKGIKVVDAGAQVTNKVDAREEANNVLIGQMQAKFMVDALHGQGTVAMLPGPAGVSWAIDRANGFKAYVAAHSHIQIVAENWADNLEPNGLQNMQDLLTTFPNLNGLYCGGDRLAVGAAQAIKAVGKSGKIVVTTTDVAKDTAALIKAGTISLGIVQLGVPYGSVAMDLAYKLVEGQKVPPVTLVQMDEITKQNVDNMPWNLILAPKGWTP